MVTKKSWVLLLSTFLCLACLVRAGGISAKLSAEEVEAGQGVMLSLKIDGRIDAEPTIPDVKDLIIQKRGTSQQVQFVNGHMSRTLTYNYVVGSQQPGEYHIPSVRAKVDGIETQTDPLRLIVRPSGQAVPQGMAKHGTPQPPQQQPQSTDADDHGYLTFEMVKEGRKHLYPGEIVPVRIKAYFPAASRVNLRSVPRPMGHAFTLHNLSNQPQQSHERVDGKNYLVATWYGGMSATKAGEYPANFSVDATVAVPDRAQQRRGRPRGGSPFDDPFFDDAFDHFFTQMVEKDVSLKSSDPPTVEVRELPSENRPDDFAGAIGSFEFESIRLPSQMKTGEPVRVTAKVKGKGNFSLLSQPDILPKPEWKSYHGKDDFHPTDAASFSGTKTFEFSVVPLQPGRKNVSLGFSYFDPEIGEYRHIESNPEAVEITGQPMQDDKPASVARAESPPDTAKVASLRESLGEVMSSRPLTDEAWFAPAAVGSGVLTLGLLLLGWSRQRQDDPRRRVLKEARAVRAQAVATAKKAADQGDVAAFLTAARDAFRCQVAWKAGIRPQAVTLSDIKAHVSPEACKLWQHADQMEYSGQLPNAASLREWSAVLDEELAELEAKS